MTEAQFDPTRYGRVFERLVSVDRNRALGPGRPVAAAREQLAALHLDPAFGRRRLVDREMGELCLAAVWLIHDYLAESHTISQGIESTSGAYWHAIMHRREPDESNAKYWIHRIGDHPVYQPLCAAARQLAEHLEAPGEAAFLAQQRTWDPEAFVDLCAGARRKHNSHESLCRLVQQREWELLFDACYSAAVGA